MDVVIPRGLGVPDEYIGIQRAHKVVDVTDEVLLKIHGELAKCVEFAFWWWSEETIVTVSLLGDQRSSFYAQITMRLSWLRDLSSIREPLDTFFPEYAERLGLRTPEALRDLIYKALHREDM